MTASPLIKVCSPSFSQNVELRTELLRRFPRSIFNREGRRLVSRELGDFLKDAQGAVVGLERVGAPEIQSCPGLRAIGKYGVGLDNIDLAACRRFDVRVLHTPGVNRYAVAELALGFMLALCRNWHQAGQALKQGRWEKNGGRQLAGKTVGIIGVGHVGKELIRLLKPFGCAILANDIISQDAYFRKHGCVKASKPEIFRRSDIVTLHVPLTPLTRGMIGRGALKAMRRDAFLVNTARGGIVDEAALKQALKNGTIAGAALDVYAEEPPRDRGLLALQNLITTPHIGGNSREAVLAMGLSAIDHLTNFFSRARRKP